ncbi:MAG: nitroreductase family deazaflavin-dependent oxidoreductase [Acidimicrobiia bacterium]
MPKPYTKRQERVGNVVIKYMTKFNVWVQRKSNGRFLAKFPGGAPIGILTTIGRKSGQPRDCALLYLLDGKDVVIVASKGGMPKHPDWYVNLLDNPNVNFVISGHAHKYMARTADPAEKARLWPELVRMYKGYEDYQARTSRSIPVVICSPVN